MQRGPGSELQLRPALPRPTSQQPASGARSARTSTAQPAARRTQPQESQRQEGACWQAEPQEAWHEQEGLDAVPAQRSRSPSWAHSRASSHHHEGEHPAMRPASLAQVTACSEASSLAGYQAAEEDADSDAAEQHEPSTRPTWEQPAPRSRQPTAEQPHIASSWTTQGVSTARPTADARRTGAELPPGSARQAMDSRRTAAELPPSSARQTADARRTAAELLAGSARQTTDSRRQAAGIASARQSAGAVHVDIQVPSSARPTADARRLSTTLAGQAAQLPPGSARQTADPRRTDAIDSGSHAAPVPTASARQTADSRRQTALSAVLQRGSSFSFQQGPGADVAGEGTAQLPSRRPTGNPAQVSILRAVIVCMPGCLVSV